MQLRLIILMVRLVKFKAGPNVEKKPFIELKIEDGLWEETYLAALLSC